MLIRCNDCHREYDEGLVTPDKLCLGCFRPEASAWRKVAKGLRSYAIEAGESKGGKTFLSMDSPKIKKMPAGIPSMCRTVACFAGHYFMAKLQEREIRREAHPWRFEILDRLPYQADGTPVLVNTGTGKTVDYQKGVDLIAEDLGFAGHWQLEEWAELHPNLWGGFGGQFMFSTTAAFGQAGPELTVLDIAAWLDRVGIRTMVEEDSPEGFRTDPQLAVFNFTFNRGAPALTDEELEPFARPQR